MQSELQHTTIRGSCHCGNIHFVLRWPQSESQIPVRRCSCTFCQKHSGAWTSHRDAVLSVEVDDRSLLSRYRFGTETADFYICSACGVAPLVLSEIDDCQYAVVNVNSFEDIGGLSFSSSASNFDGEGTETRLERRKRNWIPNVLLTTSATGPRA